MLQATVNLNLGSQAQTAQLPSADQTFAGFIGALLEGVMAIAFLILLVYLVWAAIEWITAGGDSSKIQKARDKITQSIIGILVLASVVALYVAVQSFIGVDVLRFSGNQTTPVRPPGQVVPLDQQVIPPGGIGIWEG